jgi:hypothetical protein
MKLGLRKEKEEKSNEQNIENPMAALQYERIKHYEDESVELDAIERLKSNILMLDDLQKRLSFMNHEIEKIIGSKK